jgi:molecular chaperone DnaK
MVREAEQHAQEDRQNKEEVELRNRADSVAYQAERTLKDASQRVSSTLRSQVEDNIRAVRDALSRNDVTSIRSTSEDLERLMQQVSQELYSQTDSASSNGSSSTTRDNEAGAVEGEYREV